VLRIVVVAGACGVFINAQAIVPQRYLKDIYPVDDAIASFNKMIRSENRSSNKLADLYRGRGLHFAELHRYREAIDDYTRSLNVNSTNVISYINRAVAYARLEQYQEAFADFNKAEKLDVNNEAIYKNRGALNFLLGHFEDAIRDYKYYLSLRPGDMYRMIWLHLSQKYLNKNADSSLDRYVKNVNLEQWPGAIVKLYRGEVSVETFLEAFSRKGAHWDSGSLCEAYYYLGQYFLLNGQRSLAVDALHKAVRTNATSYIEYEFATAYLQRLTSQ
jgi:lipoprotein NlpI